MAITKKTTHRRQKTRLLTKK